MIDHMADVGQMVPWDGNLTIAIARGVVEAQTKRPSAIGDRVTITNPLAGDLVICSGTIVDISAVANIVTVFIELEKLPWVIQ